MTVKSNDTESKLALALLELKKLKNDVSTLKNRVDYLEGRARKEIPASDFPPSTSIEEKPSEKETPRAPKSSDLETRIGEKWLNRIGIIAVIIGIAFFIKYAFDNQWIGPTGRVVLGMLIGIGFIVFGEYLKGKYRTYSQGLVGGGIAILYVSLFAAASYYEIIPLNVGRILMVVVTIFGVLLSIRYDASAIALLGFMGGYLTPPLLSSGQNQEVALFTYITLLNLGVFSLAYFKDWKFLNIFAFVATSVIFALWADEYYTADQYLPTQIFLVVFFITFAFLGIFYHIIHKAESSIVDLIFIFAVATSFFAASYFNLKEHYPGWMGLFSGVMALFYFLFSLLAYKRVKGEQKLTLTFLAISLSFLAIMVPIQLEKHWITIGWVVLATAVTWIGIRLDNGELRWAGFFLLLAAVLKFFIYDVGSIDVSSPSFIAFINERFLTAFAVALTMFFLTYLYARKRMREEFALASSILFVAANLFLLLFLSIEVSSFFQNKMFLLQTPSSASNDATYRNAYDNLVYAERFSLSILWALYSVTLMIFGFIKKVKLARIFSILLFALTIFKVFIFDLSSLEAFYRILSFIGLGTILLAASFLYARYKNTIIEAVVGEKQEKNRVK